MCEDIHASTYSFLVAMFMFVSPILDHLCHFWNVIKKWKISRGKKIVRLTENPNIGNSSTNESKATNKNRMQIDCLHRHQLKQSHKWSVYEIYL